MTAVQPELIGVQPARAQLKATGKPGGPHLFGFAWDNGALVVCKTGVRLKFGFALIWEVLHWAFYLPVLAAVALVARLRRRKPLNIWYTPDRAGPWYLLRGAALWAGYGVARTPMQGDAAFYFDDTTRGDALSLDGLPLFNGACTDISKSHVADVFAEVFGYPLKLDPQSSRGPIVEKAEKNGVHDGGVVNAPLTPRSGYTYQRLVDTTGADGMVHDLRTPCVGGRPVVVWEKTKPVERRFAIQNSRAVLRDPASVYSEVELALIAAFTARMGLDWGGLDILRDSEDGRIYIVDVNKTDLGPVIALSWGDKLRSMHRLSRALSMLVEPAMRTGRSRASHPDGLENGASSSAGWTAIVMRRAPVLALVALALLWAVVHSQSLAVDTLAENAERLRAAAIIHPALSLMLFVLTYALAVSLMLPVGLILIFVGGYVLGPVGGAAGSMAGATLGAIVSYGMARLSPSPTVQRWEARFPQLERLRSAFVEHPFRYTLSMRLMPLTPFTLISLAAGLNRIGAAPFAIGTMLGVAPECVLYASIGSTLTHGFTDIGGNPFRPALGLALFAAAILVTMTPATTARLAKRMAALR